MEGMLGITEQGWSRVHKLVLQCQENFEFYKHVAFKYAPETMFKVTY
jgi:hypothetical protein